MVMTWKMTLGWIDDADYLLIMKYIITEDQLNKIKEKILKVPFEVFDNDWSLLQDVINKKGNPPYILSGFLDLSNRGDIRSLGSIVGVEGNVILSSSDIESLGNLMFVTGFLDLDDTNISSLEKLNSVSNWISVKNTWIARRMTREVIGEKVNLNPRQVFGTED